MKNKRVFCIAGIVLAACLMLAGVIYGVCTGIVPNIRERAGGGSESETPQESAVSVPTQEKTKETQEADSVSENGTDEKRDEAARAILLDEEVEISDVYCPEGEEAVFYTYAPSAGGYEWEFYDKNLAKWRSVDELEEAETGFEPDSYNRNLSILRIPAKKSYDGMKLRCNTGSRKNIPTGLLHLIDPFESLEVPEEVQADANKLIYTSDIPVTIYYGEEKQEIRGLQGLYFVYEVSTTEDVSKDANEVTKTVTTISREERNYMTMPGDNPILIRYREGDAESDHKINIIGSDSTPPTILSYKISDHEISARDKEGGVEVKIDISAEDDCSDISDLKYCFIPETELGEEGVPDQEKFAEESTITIHTNTNGAYVICVMDEAGNIAKETADLVVVDGKAPVLSVSLEYPDMSKWYESNVIHVDAKDGTDLTYAYSCNGRDSGYIMDPFYTVTANGTWTVSAKDAAGNISSEEITITNIDHMPPTILNVAFSLPDLQQGQKTGSPDPDTLPEMLNGMTDEELRALAESLGLATSDLLRNEMEELVKEYIENLKGTLKEDITSEVESNVSDGRSGAAGKSGRNGQDGTDGTDGKDGKNGTAGQNGKTTFIAYADDASGRNFSLTPLETSKYIGTCITDAEKQPTDRGSYSNWQPYRSHIITDSTDENGVTTVHIH